MRVEQTPTIVVTWLPVQLELGAIRASVTIVILERD